MDILIIGLIIFSLILSFGIGGQDETMATVYGSGSLKLRWSILIGGLLALLGVYLLSKNVGETIGQDLLGETIKYNTLMILAIVLSTSFWLLLAAKTSVPISTTHSIVGAVFGISIIWTIINQGNFIDSLNWGILGKVFLGWIISPLLGYIGAMVGQAAINKYMTTHSNNLLEIEKNETYFRNLIIIFACVNQFSRGGNDSGSVIGIFYSMLGSNQISKQALPLLIIMAGLMFSLGLILVGKNLIKEVGSTTGQLRPSEALAIESTVAIVILVSTLLRLPVSGGHILIFALIGSAKMKGEHPDRRSFRRMVISWIITFPITAFCSALFYAILTLL